jgi:cardiolipin synthase
MLLTIIFISYILAIISAINAVMTARTSQGAIAWVIFLLSIPYFAVPTYWVFGRSRFHGYLVPRQSSDKHVMHRLETVIDKLQPFCVPSSEMTAVGLAAEKLVDLPFLNANSTQLLIDGEATFNSILQGIDAAEDYVLFQFFIVHDDEIGRKVKSHLIEKAKQGVRIYFLYDEVGCHSLPQKYINELAQAGVEIYEFNTQKGLFNRFQLNFRNHRKIVVVDGKVAWTGGHNVGDEYLGKSKKFGHWRDTHLRIEGPAALAMQISFIEDWFWAREKHLSGLSWDPVASKDDNQKILVIPSGPADILETASLMFHHAINSATQRLWIASPYFVPDDAIIHALQLAGLRGVDVRILIPNEPDHLLVYLSAFSYYDDASLTGVRFFRYTNGFLHQKVMLIDSKAATVGSANFDNRSFRLNFEITAIVSDPKFALQVEEMFTEDFKHSKEMTKEDVDKRSYAFKLAIRLAKLASPIQ